MPLRGALNRGLNIGLGMFLLVLPFRFVLIGIQGGPIFARTALINAGLAFLFGALAALPAYVLNRKALNELYEGLKGKIFLSSQLALLDSRHGKNAVAYFYFLVYLGFMLVLRLPESWGLAYGGPPMFAFGAYLSANVLPFVLPPKGKA